MPMLRRLLTSFLAASALSMPPTAARSADPPVDIRYASSAPQKSVWGMQIERIARAIAEESGNSVRLQPYFGGQLGADLEIVQQVARGRVDATGTALVFASALVPELQLLTLPMFFRSRAELDCVLDSTMTPIVSERLARRGLQFVGWGDSGTVQLIAKRPITSPGDVTGRKAGTYGSRQESLFWEALGANTAPTSSVEVSSAMQTGLIDATLTVPSFYVPTGLNRVAPALSKGDLYFLPTVVVWNKASWDRLSARQRDAVVRAYRRHPVSQLREEVRSFEARMLDAHRESGGQLIELSAQQRDAFRRALEPMWPRMVREAGPDAASFFEAIQAGLQECR